MSGIRSMTAFNYGPYFNYRYTSLIKPGSIIEFEYAACKVARALGMVLHVHWHTKWSHTTIELVNHDGGSIHIRIWQVYWIHKI